MWVILKFEYFDIIEFTKEFGCQLQYLKTNDLPDIVNLVRTNKVNYKSKDEGIVWL
jgi:hypothetical protein